MEIKEIRKDLYSVVKINGRLDTTNYQELEKVMQEVLDSGQSRIIIDCSEMNYISSSGLRVFLMYLKKIRTDDGRLLVSNMQESIHEIFKISGFTSIFEIYGTLEEAEKELSA